MDTRHGWLSDDPSHHITHRHPLLRLCHIRSDSDYRYLHRGTCSSSRPPLPRYRHGTCKLRKRSRERGRRGQRDNVPYDVLGWNLLASRDTARHHEDHSQLHAVNIRQRRTKRCADIRRTRPSLDKHHNSARPCNILHCLGLYFDELEGRVELIADYRYCVGLSKILPLSILTS